MSSSAPALLGWIPLAGLLLAGAAPPAQRQARGETPPVASFEGSLGQARDLALERNVPLLVAAFYEDEQWTEKGHHDEVGMRRELFERPEWAEALARGLLVLACNRVHEPETIEVERDGVMLEVQRCSAYRTPDCSTHQRLFEDVFAAWNEDGVLQTPFVLVLRPDGEVGQRWSDRKTPERKQLLAAVAAVREAIGAGLDERELALVRGHEADARLALERGADGLAWRAWHDLLELNETTPAAARAREGIEGARARVAERRAAAQAALAEGRAIEAWTALGGLREECAGLGIERELASELRALETHPEHKDAIRAHVRELEAAELLREVDALVRAGDERKARARCRKLLRAFDGTRAAAEARERHAGLLD